jgi:AcrR family transcriptional regulator
MSSSRSKSVQSAGGQPHEGLEGSSASEALDTRERILRATWRLLEERRGQNVRLEDVARAANVSRQAVYLHFGSRTTLFVETARYADESLRLMERIRQACDAETGVIAIEAYVRFWADYVPDIYGLAKALLALRETDEAAAAWNDRMAGFREGCLTILRQVERDGAPAVPLAAPWTVETAADYFYAALSIPTWASLTFERGWSREEYVERVTFAIKRALLAAPGEGAAQLQ